MIRKYTASADNTIVSAYELNLTTRGTGSNAGRADILETFSIYGRATTSSQELSRILINFPIDQISADRTSGKVPASASVNFYLKMYNAPHSKTVGRDYKLVVQPVSASWQEGDGLDLEGYKDITHDGVGSNWINANDNHTAATATLTALSKTAGQANTRVLTIYDIAENNVSFTIDNSLTTSTATKIAFGNANSNATQFATNIAAAINAAQSAGTLNVTATSSDATVTLSQTTEGLAGNSVSNIVGTAVTDSVITVTSQFSGGDGKWNNVGGDYLEDRVYTQTFSDGTENLEINITDMVEEWITGSSGGKYDNYGMSVRMSASYEGSSSAAYVDEDSNVILNTVGAEKSYYTKRFFGRGTQYFFYKPTIEARWDSATRDDRGNFYFSSSRAPAADNMNTIYFYNRIRGRLVNIPEIGKGEVCVSLFSGSENNSMPSGSAQKIINSSNSSVTVLTGGYVDTGIYSCSICITASSATGSLVDTFYDVWFSGSDSIADATAASEQYFTGSILPLRHDTGYSIGKPSYYLSITNLQSKYKADDTVRLNLFVRKKDWSPTIYTVAKSEIESETILSASYRVYRLLDGFGAVPYGTGSDLHTALSYDISGNYFDLDMSLLEPGYGYGLKFCFYDERNLSWQEQDYVFKFRVEDYEY